MLYLYSEMRLGQLTACTVRGDCRPNAHKIIIYATRFCVWTLFDEFHGGEGIW